MKKTPLHATHVSLGARMIEFAGWEMPAQYTSITEEHMAVRTAAGVFDVSHMGDLIIRGEGAGDLLQRLLTNDITDAGVGQAVYAHIPDDRGRILDDTIITQIRRDEYLMVPNAGTIPRILALVREHATTEEVVDASDRLACIALQGPGSERIMQTLTPYNLTTMGLFTGNPLPPTLHDFRPAGFLTDLFSFEVSQRPRGVQKVGGGFAEQCYVSRTGYTGEDGFEILIENSSAASLWGVPMHVGKGYGSSPLVSGRGTPYASRWDISSRERTSTERRRVCRPAPAGWSGGITSSLVVMPSSSRGGSATTGGSWDSRWSEEGYPGKATRSWRGAWRSAG